MSGQDADRIACILQMLDDMEQRDYVIHAKQILCGVEGAGTDGLNSQLPYKSARCGVHLNRFNFEAVLLSKVAKRSVRRTHIEKPSSGRKAVDDCQTRLKSFALDSEFPNGPRHSIGGMLLVVIPIQIKRNRG